MDKRIARELLKLKLMAILFVAVPLIAIGIFLGMGAFDMLPSETYDPWNTEGGSLTSALFLTIPTFLNLATISGIILLRARRLKKLVNMSDGSLADRLRSYLIVSRVGMGCLVTLALPVAFLALVGILAWQKGLGLAGTVLAISAIAHLALTVVISQHNLAIKQVIWFEK